MYSTIMGSIGVLYPFTNREVRRAGWQAPGSALPHSEDKGPQRQIPPHNGQARSVSGAR